MKIVQINTVCKRGSVGRIALELYTMTEKQGNEAFFVYGRNSAPSDIKSYKTGNVLDFSLHVLKNFCQDKSGFGSARQTEKLIQYLERLKPDVLHLHNIHGFYLQIEKLFDYIKRSQVPVVWTLHDCWAFTGHCAYYDYVNCSGFQSGCQSCRHHARLYPYALFCDDAANNYRRKQQAFQGISKLTLVSPSRWLADEAHKSFLKKYRIMIIPNGIDLTVFHCDGEKKKSNSVELLGVANIWEARKGLGHLADLAQQMPKTWRLTIIGVSKKQKRDLEKRFSKDKVNAVLRTENISQLADYYREADVFVNPTLEDNFPTTNLEALACGTPVVTFGAGGSGEMLTPSCGVIVSDRSAAGLINGIGAALELQPKDCREQAYQYDKESRMKEYMALYESVARQHSLGGEE